MKPRVSSAEGEVVESGRVPVVCDQGPCSPPNTPATRYWTESPGDSPVSIQGWNGDPPVKVPLVTAVHGSVSSRRRCRTNESAPSVDQVTPSASWVGNVVSPVGAGGTGRSAEPAAVAEGLTAVPMPNARIRATTTHSGARRPGRWNTKASSQGYAPENGRLCRDVAARVRIEGRRIRRGAFGGVCDGEAPVPHRRSRA